jgi:hypothetical protein
MELLSYINKFTNTFILKAKNLGIDTSSIESDIYSAFAIPSADLISDLRNNAQESLVVYNYDSNYFFIQQIQNDIRNALLSTFYPYIGQTVGDSIKCMQMEFERKLKEEVATISIPTEYSITVGDFPEFVDLNVNIENQDIQSFRGG